MAAAAAIVFSSSSSPGASVMASSPRVPAKPFPSLASSRSPLFAQGIRGRTASLVVASRRRTGRSGGLGARCLFGLGVPELVVIAGVAALVFGPKKLPEVGRSIGKTVKSFQQAAKEFETELKKEPEGTSEQPPPAESSEAISSEDEKKKLETSGTKDSS